VTDTNNSTESAIDPIFAAIARHEETGRRFALAVRATDDVQAARDGRIITRAERDEDKAALAPTTPPRPRFSTRNRRPQPVSEPYGHTRGARPDIGLLMSQRPPAHHWRPFSLRAGAAESYRPAVARPKAASEARRA
jgi:hypothetical protein